MISAPKKALSCLQCALQTQGHPGQACPNDDRVLVSMNAAQKHADDPLLGTRIDEKYALVDVLGQGGFGRVYRGIEEGVGRAVAIKVIRDRETGDTADLRRRFRQEAAAIGQLSHSATVKLLSSGEHHNLLYMALELIEGETLRAALKRAALAPKRAIALALEILESLHEAHGLGVVHRDLKPGNVMLTRTPFGGDGVKVLDFGIAKLLRGDAPELTVETSEGHVYGSPRYMAPEQARGIATPRSDLYAVGVMLFEMVTGAAPFSGRTAFDTMLLHASAERPSIPGQPALNAVIQRAMAQDPDERFADALAMASALRALGNLAPIDLADPETRPLPTATGEDSEQTETPAWTDSSTASPDSAPTTSRSRWLWLAVPAVAALFWWSQAPAPERQPRSTLTIDAPKLGAESAEQAAEQGDAAAVTMPPVALPADPSKSTPVQTPKPLPKPKPKDPSSSKSQDKPKPDPKNQEKPVIKPVWL